MVAGGEKESRGSHWTVQDGTRLVIGSSLLNCFVYDIREDYRIRTLSKVNNIIYCKNDCLQSTTSYYNILSNNWLSHLLLIQLIHHSCSILCCSLWTMFRYGSLSRYSNTSVSVFMMLLNYRPNFVNTNMMLWSLEERRNSADLIELFKMVRGLSSVPLQT